MIYDPLRFDTDDVFAQRMSNQKDKKQMAAGLLSSGAMNDKCMWKDHNMMSHMTGLAQALWLNFLGEVIFHPNYMARLVAEHTGSTHVPNVFIKEGITAIHRDLYREGYKLEKNRSPYDAKADDFLVQLESAVPGLLAELKGFFNSMRVHAIYLSLTDTDSVAPRSLLSRFLRDHSGNNMRLEPYFVTLRVILMNLTKEHTRKLSIAQVQWLMLSNVSWFLTLLLLEIQADMFLLAYVSTKGHFIPRVVMKRAEWLRLYYAQQPQVWLLGVPEPSDPHKLEDKYIQNSLFQGTRQTLKDVFCIRGNGTQDYHSFRNNRKFQDFDRFPYHVRFGRPTRRRDDQTQAQFEAEWAEENVNWIPPAEMLSISPKAETDFHSQIKDKALYSELVCEGQKDGETDQEFMNRLRSMTLTTEEYRSSPKRVFQYVPDDKSDGDSSSKPQDPKNTEPKDKQQPPSAPQPKPVPQKQQTVPPKQQTAPQKQEKKGVPQAQSKKVAQSLAKPLTVAAYHAK
ncbi:MAG: hypothetical protein GY820_22525, partial [Gammaproteobacteria bacterium]|nr:hypothetical protein [Gammaproteobacteria bacterium]